MKQKCKETFQKLIIFCSLIHTHVFLYVRIYGTFKSKGIKITMRMLPETVYDSIAN